MTARTILSVLLLLSLSSNAQELSPAFEWPPVTSETKPWARWWWPASIFTEKDMSAALQKYNKAGLGGMELTVLYGVRGEEEKFVNYLSPAWMKNFSYILKECQRLNLGLDLANASSWPFGGPWVTNNDAAKYVAYKTFKLKGDESLAEKIEYTQEPFIRWSGPFRTDIKNITDPVYKNSNLQELSIDQIRFEKTIPLQELIAYSDKGKIINLTGKVGSNGKLEWIAPEGTWTLYAVFQGWHGKMVERAGPGGEGYVIDHFSGDAIKNYLSRFDEALKGSDLSSLRGYFNDSYEVDDARGQSCWTPGIFTEFSERRGYDLREYLPALFQKDDPEKNARILSDYRQTISDLVLDKFTKGWTSWANQQGKTTRNQSHGSPANILDLYAASDIPETEGTDIFRTKFATSAANVSGKKLVSAEAATWLGEHFSSTLFDVKKNVDQYFIGGVNHIIYHGTCFSPESEPWPGFQFYAAVEFSPANSFWNDLQILNSYVTRVQSFMQNAKPDNDILLYFPIFDRYADYNGNLLEHFDAISPQFNGSHFKNAAELMNRDGYAFDYISDAQISGVLVDESKLFTGGVPYQVLILPNCKYIPLGTFNKIVNLADKGATIIFYGNMPGDVAGWKELGDNREMFVFLKEQLNFTPTGKDSISEARFGKGRILMGDNLNALLKVAGVRREKMADAGIAFSRRKIYDGNYYFILNPSVKPFIGWITLGSKSKSAAIFDPMRGIKGVAKVKISAAGTDIYLRLNPGQSLIIQTSEKRHNGDPFQYYDRSGETIDLKGKWEISFTEGGPVLPQSQEVTELKSWTEFNGEDFRNFSGTAEYRIRFARPSGKAETWQLNLGKVCESARIYLNGNEIAKLIGPDYQTVIEKFMLQPENDLVIKVSNLSANRVAWLDRNNVNWKKFYNTNFPARLPQNRKNGLFDASAWSPRESGLIGPVTITPVKKFK